jgi:flagellar basal body rod protein FlgC
VPILRHMDLSDIALLGLQRADAQLEQAASRIANAATLSPDGSNVDTVDISAEIVALVSAKNQFSVNAATLKVANQVQKSAVDLLA